MEANPERNGTCPKLIIRCKIWGTAAFENSRKLLGVNTGGVDGRC